MDAAQYILVITTCSNSEEAAQLARQLVESRLAACVQCSPIESTYRWKDAIESASEVRLTAKARAEDFKAIEEFIKARHSYQTPELVALTISAGSAEYLGWINEETKR